MNNNIESWRQHRPVLVTDAHERLSVAVIRSLGRAGYPVHACSPMAEAAGFHSNFAAGYSVCPPFDSDEFIPWLRRTCEAHRIACIVPGEDLLLALRPHFEEFCPLLPLSNDRATVYRGISKFDLFQTLLDHGSANIPPLVLIEPAGDLPGRGVLGELGTPLFVKADGRYALHGMQCELHKSATPEAAQRTIAQVATRYSRFLVQGHAPGEGVGAFLLRWNGEYLAQFMHRRLHEIPLEGWSSYRKSWWHAQIMRDARARLEQMQWQGVAMMEYRWDPTTDRFMLIEMNGRFWGSLHLALFAEVDFPALLLDAFHGKTPQPVSGEKANVYCRNTVLELRYVWSRLRDARVGIFERLWSVAEFFLLMLNPKVKSDLLFPGDRKLFWWQIQHYTRRLFRRKRGVQPR